MADKLGLSKRWQSYRPSKTAYFWSCVACILGTIIIGFAWGGWTTASSAARMASEAANDARTKLAAAICVTKFDTGADVKTELAQLKGTSSWERDDFIVKGGWATLPGMKAPLDGVADLCAQQLMTEKQPDAKPAGNSG